MMIEQKKVKNKKDNKKFYFQFYKIDACFSLILIIIRKKNCIETNQRMVNKNLDCSKTKLSESIAINRIVSKKTKQIRIQTALNEYILHIKLYRIFLFFISFQYSGAVETKMRGRLY